MKGLVFATAVAAVLMVSSSAPCPRLYRVRAGGAGLRRGRPRPGTCSRLWSGTCSRLWPGDSQVALRRSALLRCRAACTASPPAHCRSGCGTPRSTAGLSSVALGLTSSTHTSGDISWRGFISSWREFAKLAGRSASNWVRRKMGYACSGRFCHTLHGHQRRTLFLAQRVIPMGTAYAVWTGIGAVGCFIVGIAAYGDAATSLRIASAGLILAGVVGLKFG